jgi:uncharacterized membrane protein
MSSLLNSIKRNLLAGLLVLIPFGITLLIVFKISTWVVGIISFAPANMFDSLADLPKPLHQYVTFSIGLIGALLIIISVGVAARLYIGKKLLEFGESIIAKIPFANTVYSATKQIIETVLLSKGFQGIKRVVLLEFPRKGIYSIGFVTGNISGNIHSDISDKNLLSVFVPNTPNPTSGFYLMVSEDEIHELSLSVEQAFKIIISGGIASKDIEFIKQIKNNNNQA